MRGEAWALTIWVATAACTAGSDATGDFGEGGTGGTPTEGGESGSASTDDGEGDGVDGAGPGDDDTGAGTEGIKFDLAGGAADDGGLPTSGCQKIDFLFVVDDSGSMGVHQAALVASFPGFIDAIGQSVTGQDHHIMVVTSASLESKGKGGSYCACQTDDCCHEVCETGYYASCGSSCGGPACPAPSDPCRATYGAGKTRATGEYNVEAPLCPIAGGQRYLQAGQPALEETFACMATTATFGTDENNATVMLAALAPAMNEAGGCNEGFLRDDAILVVTILSDASITASEQDAGDPQAWHDELVALKGGNEEAIVMIGLLNDVQNEGEDCYNLGPADKLFTMVDLFGERGFAATICQDDYSEIFAQAVIGIDAACDAFEPEG